MSDIPAADDRTAFRHIRKVQPAHIVWIDGDRVTAEITGIRPTTPVRPIVQRITWRNTGQPSVRR